MSMTPGRNDEPFVPQTVEQALRKSRLDRFTGSVLLNYRDGRIMGFHKTEIRQLQANEII